MKGTVTFPGLGLEFTIDRVAFNLFGRDIYWYGIIIACGFALAVIYAYCRAKSFGLVPDDILNMLIVAVPSAIICARAYYVIFHYDLYRGDFLSAISFWDGGLAIYGGVIGGVTAAVIYAKVKKINVGAMLDIGGLGFLIGQSIGRWGNFINREAHGGVTDLPWRMGIYEGGELIYVHPTFLYESLWNALGFVVLHFFSKKYKKYDGQIFILYVMWYGLGRMMIEGLRTDSLYLFGTGIRVSQLLAFLSFLVAVILLAINAVRHKKALAADIEAVESTGDIEGTKIEEEDDGCSDN